MKPRMRCQRTMMSICVWLSMCPMCSRPVTFGGGRSRVNTGRIVFSEGRPSGGVETEKSFSLIQYSAQRVSIAPGSYALGNSCGIEKNEHSVFDIQPVRSAHPADNSRLTAD